MASNSTNNYIPRLSKPSAEDKHYINYKYGGYNTCIVLDTNNGYVLPNCVGYAQGRLLEINGYNKCDWKIPACNAEDWYEKANSNGLKVGTSIRLGAVIVWGKGKLHNSSDGCGHVAIVEQINSDGSIVISESGYKTFTFRTSVLKPPYNLKGYTLLGYIYPYKDYGVGSLGATDNSTNTNEQTITHTVCKGDTLWGISKKYLGSGTRYKEIMTVNNLRTTVINVGQVLKIPNK